MKNFFVAIRAHLNGTLIASLTALALGLTLAGFYLADSVSGNGTALSKTLVAIGFCSESDFNAPATDGEAGSDGFDGLDGVDGADGAPGTDGSPGSTGTAGTCSPLDTAALGGNLVPAKDNIYSLGTANKRWKSIQLGPGTLFIQDTETGKQAGLTISDGTLLLDGVDGLRIGNIRFTSTGITSLLPNQDITVGTKGDTGWLAVARGIKFPDGTTQYSAAAEGAIGPRGLTGAIGARGLTGATGAQGPTGSIEDLGYKETKACMYTGKPDIALPGTLLIGTCEELRLEGKDMDILVRQ